MHDMINNLGITLSGLSPRYGFPPGKLHTLCFQSLYRLPGICSHKATSTFKLFIILMCEAIRFFLRHLIKARLRQLAKNCCSNPGEKKSRLAAPLPDLLFFAGQNNRQTPQKKTPIYASFPQLSVCSYS